MGREEAAAAALLLALEEVLPGGAHHLVLLHLLLLLSLSFRFHGTGQIGRGAAIVGSFHTPIGSRPSATPFGRLLQDELDVVVLADVAAAADGVVVVRQYRGDAPDGGLGKLLALDALSAAYLGQLRGGTFLTGLALFQNAARLEGRRGIVEGGRDHVAHVRIEARRRRRGGRGGLRGTIARYDGHLHVGAGLLRGGSGQILARFAQRRARFLHADAREEPTALARFAHAPTTAAGGRRPGLIPADDRHDVWDRVTFNISSGTPKVNFLQRFSTNEAQLSSSQRAQNKAACAECNAPPSPRSYLQKKEGKESHTRRGWAGC